MLYRVLKSFTTLSIILFVPVLLLAYAFLGEECGILFTGTGESVFTLAKNEFFYAFLFSFFLFQVIIYLYQNSTAYKKKDKNAFFAIWFQGMALAVNLFFILMIIFIGFANNAVDYTFGSITFIGYAGPVILMIWLIASPVFLLKKKTSKNSA